jgi:hypothetical protein
MKNKMQNTYAAFISFAQPDKELAEALHKLLTHVGLTSHYAPKDLPEKLPTGWKKGIIEVGIRKSSSFILICTKQSLNRSWVLFEAGAAAALGVKCYCTRVQSVSDADIESIPDPDDLYHFKLFERHDLQNLLINVAREHLGEACQEVLENINKIFVTPPHRLVSNLLTIAASRWIFIAGNVPRGGHPFPQKRVHQMNSFVAQLTQRLLDAGFSIAACPQIETVGKEALKTAEKYIADNSDGNSAKADCVDYEIGGLWPIDSILRTKPLGWKRAESKWQEHLMRFRKSYLYKQEWLFLLGGTEGTLEEYQAAEAINRERGAKIKTFSIPCFGGTAAKVFQKLENKPGCQYLEPCRKCKDMGNKCRKIDQIVDKIKKS